MISKTLQGKRDPLPNPSSTVDPGHEEMKKLLERVKQLELEKGQKEQRRVEMERKATEEKRRLETENQAKIERIKRQHETELKRARDLKYETPVQLPKSTPPLPSVSQTTTPRLMPPPKPKATPEQLKLQDQLIAACKQGDEKAVKTLLQRGARPDMANAKGEQPLGAAVCGMCPDVVNALLKQAGGVAPMTWQECEQHNKKYYNNEVFIIPKFDPRTYSEWYALLQKMDPNPFIRAFHLKKVDEQWLDKCSSSWEKFVEHVWKHAHPVERRWHIFNWPVGISATEKGYISYRIQIKQGIESAKQPTVRLNF